LLDARATALQAIYAAGLDPSLWQAAMDAVSAAAPGVRSYMLHANTAAGAPQRSLVSGYYPAFLQSWDAYYGHINAWTAGFVSGPVGQPRYRAWMCDDATLTRTEFYADWVRPQDELIGGGGIVLKRTATQLTLFGGNMPARIRDRMDDQWQRDLALFGPAIRFALDANAAMLSLSLDLVLAQRGVTVPGSPEVVLLDQGGRILFANPVAEALILSGRVLRVGPTGRVSVGDPGVDAVLHHMLGPGGDPVAIRRLPGFAGVLRLFRLSEQNAATLRLPPLPPGRRAAVVAVISAADAPPTGLVERLAQDLGLTTAEARIALGLADGQTLSEIAEARRVSVHTLRNQVKSALSTTGARRQADLVALVERLRR
jgi:DNA-binding CsgD family transcriptional regulator